MMPEESAGCHQTLSGSSLAGQPYISLFPVGGAEIKRNTAGSRDYSCRWGLGMRLVALTHWSTTEIFGYFSTMTQPFFWRVN